MAPLDGAGRVVTIVVPDLERWARLTEELQAAEIEDRGRPAIEPPGWAGPRATLQSILGFLASVFPNDTNILDPLLRLNCAMIDLQDGLVSPMFKPSPQNGRPHNPTLFETTKGTAARAMNELMVDGMPRKAAAQAVLKACGSLRHHGKITWKTIAGWRDVLDAGEGPGAPAAGAALFAYRRPLPDRFGDFPGGRGAALIEALRAQAGRLD